MCTLQSKQARGGTANPSAVKINKHGRCECTFPRQLSNFTCCQTLWFPSRRVSGEQRPKKRSLVLYYQTQPHCVGSFYTWLTSELWFWFVDMSAAVRAASVNVFFFIQITYSAANLVESLASFFHSQSLSTHPIYLSLWPPRHTTQSHIVCAVVTRQPHFRDDFPCVMKQALSGATADYMASYGDQSLCINTFLKKAIDAAQHVDG